MVISKANYRTRVERIQEQMMKNNIAAAVLEKPQNSYYVTGYQPMLYSRPIYVVLVQHDEPTLIVPYLREPQAKDESWVTDIKPYFEFPVMNRTFPRDSLTALKEELSRKAVLNKTIGIEMEHISANALEILRKILPDAKLVDVSALIEQIRSIKDQEEVELIRTACGLADLAMNRASEVIAERGTEKDVVIEGIQTMQDEWKMKHSNLNIYDLTNISTTLWGSCESGPQNQLHQVPHKPTDRRISDGDLVTVVMIPALNGYRGELERTFAVGQPGEKAGKMFNAVLEARQKAFDLIKPGAMFHEVDEAARDVFKKYGMLDYMRHGVGHSMGLELHEGWIFRKETASTIQRNMVFTIEPGLYHEGIGSVRHSDTVRVTSTGFEFLTKYDRGFLTR